MSDQPHLQILNKSHSLGNESGHSFRLFPSLPQELRLMIWRASLKRERIIRLSIASPRKVKVAFGHQVLYTHGAGSALPIQNMANSGLFDDISSQPSGIEHEFGVVVSGRNVLSKLLRVNRESRSEAREFYRICIPCDFTRDNFVNRTTEPTSLLYTLPFNPEYDFLYVKFRSQPYQLTLAAFLLYIKTCLDPHYIGVRNLALDCGDLSETHSAPWEICTQSERKTITESFRDLNEVFFITEPSCQLGRHIFPSLSHGVYASTVIFNRSTPILSQYPAFSRLARDPRPIERDLRKVFTSRTCPETAILPWSALLKALNATGGQTLYSWVLAYRPSKYVDSIYSMNDAQVFVQREDDAWNGRVEGPSISDSLDRAIACGRASPDIRTKDLDQAAPPAFGYWQFALRSEGIESHRAQDNYPQTWRLLDLSAFSPALLLADLF